MSNKRADIIQQYCQDTYDKGVSAFHRDDTVVFICDPRDRIARSIIQSRTRHVDPTLCDLYLVAKSVFKPKITQRIFFQPWPPEVLTKAMARRVKTPETTKDLQMLTTQVPEHFWVVRMNSDATLAITTCRCKKTASPQRT